MDIVGAIEASLFLELSAILILEEPVLMNFKGDGGQIVI